MKKDKKIPDSQISTDTSEGRIEIVIGLALFAFGVYHSILYFGHTIVPNSDFPDFFRVGKEILSLQMPSSFKLAPVLGILQNLLVFVSWGPSPELTAGHLLNAILHPFTVVLLWLVGKRIIGRASVWFALIVSINPWTVYYLTEPIIETPFLFFILLTLYLIFCRSRWAYFAASITTMVRYEGAALILAAFVADIIHRKDKRDITRAILYSVLASIPLILWLSLTFITWKAGTSHYFNVLFSKEYSKGFTEPVSDRTGLMLHLKLLWQVAFQPLLIPYARASEDFAQTLLKLGITAAVVGFVLGCVFAIFKRRWEVLMVLLFFGPYFILHAYYPYPLTRFHSTIFWIAILVAWFGLQSAAGLLAKKIPIPQVVVFTLQAALTIGLALWCISLASYFKVTATVSPDSISMPYVSMLFVGLIIATRLFAEWLKRSQLFLRYIPGNLCVASVLCLIIASNQFSLAQLLGNGKREIEFKQLGEWFAANAKPNEKLVVYMDGPTRLYASKMAVNVVGYPKSESPKDLVEKLRKMGVTYVVWATREGYSHGEHTGYQQLGLNKNIAFLEKPRSIGCYEMVTQVGSEKGYVNVFRLKDKGDEQLPNAGN